MKMTSPSLLPSPPPPLPSSPNSIRAFSNLNSPSRYPSTSVASHARLMSMRLRCELAKERSQIDCTVSSLLILVVAKSMSTLRSNDGV